MYTPKYQFRNGNFRKLSKGVASLQERLLGSSPSREADWNQMLLLKLFIIKIPEQKQINQDHSWLTITSLNYNSNKHMAG